MIIDHLLAVGSDSILGTRNDFADFQLGMANFDLNYPFGESQLTENMGGETARTLFIGDLSYFCTEEDLLSIFAAYGPILTVRIRRGVTGDSLMHGFIAVASMEAAQRAINDLDGIEFMGRNMKVQLSADGQKTSNDPKENYVQVHVSFISKQMNYVITEKVLRSLFSVYGRVADVAIKKHTAVPKQHRQSGYGFVYYFEMDAAVRALHALKHNTVHDITIDCSISYKTDPVTPRSDPRNNRGGMANQNFNFNNHSGPGGALTLQQQPPRGIQYYNTIPSASSYSQPQSRGYGGYDPYGHDGQYQMRQMPMNPSRPMERPNFLVHDHPPSSYDRPARFDREMPRPSYNREPHPHSYNNYPPPLPREYEAITSQPPSTYEIYSPRQDFGSAPSRGAINNNINRETNYGYGEPPARSSYPEYSNVNYPAASRTPREREDSIHSAEEPFSNALLTSFSELSMREIGEHISSQRATPTSARRSTYEPSSSTYPEYSSYAQPNNNTLLSPRSHTASFLSHTTLESNEGFSNSIPSSGHGSHSHHSETALHSAIYRDYSNSNPLPSPPAASRVVPVQDVMDHHPHYNPETNNNRGENDSTVESPFLVK